MLLKSPQCRNSWDLPTVLSAAVADRFEAAGMTVSAANALENDILPMMAAFETDKKCPSIDMNWVQRIAQSRFCDRAQDS
jgi:hypothetical protein